jgi:hypothetical protein
MENCSMISSPIFKIGMSGANPIATATLFQDEGWLTAWRMSASTALAAHVIAP